MRESAQVSSAFDLRPPDQCHMWCVETVTVVCHQPTWEPFTLLTKRAWLLKISAFLLCRLRVGILIFLFPKYEVSLLHAILVWRACK